MPGLLTRLAVAALIMLLTTSLGEVVGAPCRKSAATPAADLRFTPTLIAFTPHGRFTRVSAADLIQNDRHDAAIAGRHVVVGVTATGIDTSFPTPAQS